MDEKLLQGRQLLKKEIPKRAYEKTINLAFIETRKAMIITKHYIECQRCGYKGTKKNCSLTNNQYFCPQCIQLKRVDSTELLISLPVGENLERDVTFCFEGVLTTKQNKVSQDLLKAYARKTTHLIHAVTGAGKTEMLFELIKQVLSDGGRIGISAPRVDVCLELYPRLKKVFPDEDIDLLYGESKVGFTGACFIICTTHQLLRFYHFFDVLIIDEVDAFPFRNDKYLQFGMRQSLRKEGMLVYMTATSTPSLEEEVTTSKGRISLVSRRFHGFDLPVPKLKYIKGLAKHLRKGRLPRYLVLACQQTSQKILIFFPNIELMTTSFLLLQKKFPNKNINYVYASKKDREDIIKKMRKGEWDILLTTTILERGVTFSNISVFVICADHRVYNKASLIQIAGRVGRDRYHPSGQVIFFHEGKTKAIRQAVSEIKKRNKES